jgi:O-antigen ligase
LIKKTTNHTDLDNNERWVSLLIALAMLMVPALGVPSEELLQDTFKSIILSFGTLVACFTLFWLRRGTAHKLTIHPILALPLTLCLYATVSILWSHSFLACVEATRWFVLSILLIIIINIRFDLNKKRIVYGIHIGATIASIWIALQFWFDFAYFPQGPNPASTFVNRNFYAEYAVAVLPLSIYLALTSKNIKSFQLIIFSITFNIVAILMTGTRSALIALLFLTITTPAIIYRFRQYLSIARWTKKQLTASLSLAIAVFFLLGSIPTHNKSLTSEFGQQSPIARALNRTASVAQPTEYSKGSFSVRSAMWRATIEMIQSHPIAGIGAGAWEVQAPRYQNAETQVETDFYAHNELLQLIAEYGLVGWICALGLSFYLIQFIIKSFKPDLSQNNNEVDTALRAFCVLSLLALLLVSNAGFPLRLASTGALFIICIGLLATPSSKTQQINQGKIYHLNINHIANTAILIICSLSIVAATYTSALAIRCESSLVRAVKLALTISSSGKPNDPYWDETKTTMLNLLKDGIEINPHYRKLTPMVADEMASWGDWANAIWIWESVLRSRPYVIALSANIAKGYLQLGDIENAKTYLKKAAEVQPSAPTVRSIQALILTKEGEYLLAIPMLRQLLNDGFYDYDLIYAAYSAGNKTKDYELVVQALQLRLKLWPREATDAWMKLGDVYSRTELLSKEKATFCYRMALQASPTLRQELLAKMPIEYQNTLRDSN